MAVLNFTGASLERSLFDLVPDDLNEMEKGVAWDLDKFVQGSEIQLS